MTDHHTPPELRLAGDIAAQFRHVPAEDAAARIVVHLRLFWDPRMRARLHAQVAEAGADCDPVIARAVALLGDWERQRSTSTRSAPA